MCGIAGYISDKLSQETGYKMAMAMKHRGPSHQGAVVFQQQHCVLAHARLSIIDLSEGANQPMQLSNLAIVFNGEVYNFREIRKELVALGHRFELDSDTEVILHAYSEWGVKCVDRFIGMFAFAVLDKEHNELVIVRDRAGVKPLYYYVEGNTFMFASELKAFYPHPAFRRKISKKALGLYFKYGYVPAPYAIFENTHKLRQGHYLIYHLDTHTYDCHQYWNVMDFYHRPTLDISYDEAKVELERILESAFNYRMVADVPVGVFLSGGYDSTALTAILQKDRTEKLKTFTIGFPTGNNEAPIAREIARRLGTDHTEAMCSEAECKKIIPTLPFFYDEPFADNSAVPTILVSQLARKKVTVALSADAGDETFAGYNRYAGLAGIMKYLHAMRHLGGKRLADVVEAMCKTVNPYSFLHEKGETLAKLLRTVPEYRAAVATEGGSYGVLAESVYKRLLRQDYPAPLFLLDERLFNDTISVATAMDYINYMADDILVKVDRAAMSVSLEGREPLIDHRIIEFAAQLPLEFKMKDGVKKRILRDIVYKYVPRELMDRPKTGFMMPVDGWLRTDLRYLLDDNINESELDDSLFDVHSVMAIKNLYLNDRLKHENKVIWRLLMFQMWKKENM